MKPSILETEIWLPQALTHVFEFFSDARNLEKLTPPWVRFEILTSQPIVMRPGTLIDYRIRVRGIPLRWRTEIAVWDPPHRFVDAQLKGPYRLWHHTHTFVERDGGTVCGDRIQYIPWGGALANWLFVRRDVEKIFKYRQEQLKRLFSA